MQVIRALCGDGLSSQPDIPPLALRFCFPLGTENLEEAFGTSPFSLELIVTPLKQACITLPFSTQKDMVDYIFELNEVQEMSSDNICVRLNMAANLIAQKTRRGAGNCVIAGEAFYKKLTEDMCFANFTNLYTVLRSSCMLDDCAIMCYRGKVNGWDSGLFLEELPDGQFKFYEIPNETETNDKILYSNAKDYYASFRLKN